MSLPCKRTCSMTHMPFQHSVVTASIRCLHKKRLGHVYHPHTHTPTPTHHSRPPRPASAACPRRPSAPRVGFGARGAGGGGGRGGGGRGSGREGRERAGGGHSARRESRRRTRSRPPRGADECARAASAHARIPCGAWAEGGGSEGGGGEAPVIGGGLEEEGAVLAAVVQPGGARTGASIYKLDEVGAGLHRCTCKRWMCMDRVHR